MRLEDKNKILNNAVSPYTQNCYGYAASGGVEDGYILTFHLGVGISDLSISHPGSNVLSEINAFDRAEVFSSNIGQINMITVSSFCGPMGLIWGYDLAKHPDLRNESPYGVAKVSDKDGRVVPVYSIDPLLESTLKLFGTVADKRFPIRPGSHVPCAGKSMKTLGPGRIYAAIAIGIAKSRDKNANLLMEDMGMIPDLNGGGGNLDDYRAKIITNLANSVNEIGVNQNVIYEEIFTGLIDVYVSEYEVGCALVAAPYITIAQEAVPRSGSLCELTLDEWENEVL